MTFRQLAILVASLAALSAPAYADTNITVLHVSENAAQKAIWDKAAADYNASHKGVNVQFKYLENEAFKAKLPTMLQSAESRPELFYSWAGGVMQAVHVRRISHESGYDREVWQFPVILIPLGTPSARESVVLRPVHSVDGMTAQAVKMPSELLEEMCVRLFEIPEIGGVLYDLTNKPPGTIEWE